MKASLLLSLIGLSLGLLPDRTPAAPLKLHGIFSDHMVLQRDKPIRTSRSA